MHAGDALDPVEKQEANQGRCGEALEKAQERRQGLGAAWCREGQT